MNANPRTNPRVLVVDDDAVVGRSFDRVLSASGYAVSTALSGEEGMEKIGDSDYDVVFTDIKMPGMDGLEFAERIMKKCPWTPVVVVTGYGTAANETKAAVLGVSGRKEPRPFGKCLKLPLMPNPKRFRRKEVSAPS
jgi:CheY-like chemotaxis protein